MELKVSKEITCKRQNQRPETEKRTNKRELPSTTHFLDSKAKFGRLKTPSKGYVWKLALTCEPEMITLFPSKTAELPPPALAHYV